MIRTLMVHGAVALVALAAPVGVSTVDDTEPDDTSTDVSAPADSSPDESAPVNAFPDTAPGVSSSTGGNISAGPPPGDIDFQVDMMLGLVPQDEMNAYWVEEEEQRQVAVQACMNEAGFEYNPDTSGMAFEDPLGDSSTLEYAEQWGFGMYTTMDPETSPYNVDMGEDFVWPNQEIVDALSAAEQNAWYEVNNRCFNESWAQDDPYRNPMVQQALEDFYSDVDNDPRMREAADGWVDCMEEAGHPYTDQDDMYDALLGNDRQQQFYDSEAWEPDSPDYAEWQSMVELEIGVAVANAGCAPALDEIREEVIDDLRPAFVEVWRTIDWSLPPETYPGEGDVLGMPGETIVGDGSVVGDTVVEDTVDDSNAEGTETTESPVGLDLSEPADNTIPETTTDAS